MQRLAAVATVYFAARELDGAPGFAKDAAKFELTVQLLRITSPYIFFISLVSLARSESFPFWSLAV